MIKHKRNELKQYCRTLNIHELNKLLEEKNKELIKLNIDLGGHNRGCQGLMEKIKGSPSEIRRQIAIIETIKRENAKNN